MIRRLPPGAPAGARRIASVVDPFGNVLAVMHPHFLEVAASRDAAAPVPA